MKDFKVLQKYSEVFSLVCSQPFAKPPSAILQCLSSFPRHPTPEKTMSVIKVRFSLWVSGSCYTWRLLELPKQVGFLLSFLEIGFI